MSASMWFLIKNNNNNNKVKFQQVNREVLVLLETFKEDGLSKNEIMINVLIYIYSELKL